jgi:hypothetical protein
MKKFAVALVLGMASLFSTAVLGLDEIDRQCTNACGDEWEWTAAEKNRKVRVYAEDSECDVKVKVECDGGTSPGEKTLKPSEDQILECEAGRAITKVKFSCTSAEGKRCRARWWEIIEVKVPPSGGTVPFGSRVEFVPKPNYCEGVNDAISKDATKTYQAPPPADELTACRNDAANLKASAQATLEAACAALCKQKLPACKWLLLNPGGMSHSCVIGNQTPPNPPDEVVGKATTGAEFCRCIHYYY